MSPKRKYSEIGSDDSLSDEEPILDKIERMASEMLDDDDDDDYIVSNFQILSICKCWIKFLKKQVSTKNFTIKFWNF